MGNTSLLPKVKSTIPECYGYTYGTGKEEVFRWFYTYYIYTATYKELQDKGPVPLDNYLNKEEQMIWLQGNDDAFRGMKAGSRNE